MTHLPHPAPRRVRFCLAQFLVFFATCQAFNLPCPTFGQDADRIDFNREIRPLLATHCLNCHGPDESTREGGLRLDSFATATAEADSGAIPIVPGDPANSEILRRVALPADDGERMPPSGKGLNDAEKDLLVRWVRSGAKYQQHWAFTPPQKQSLPQVDDPDWIQNEIDSFVLSQLKDQRLTPNGPADRHTIVRRVYLDLTGLPPTLEEADEFVNDPKVGAYERMVDRVLASPRFGERWARIWLDLARYADSQGYAQDSPRKIYRYRDWVIEAINRNQPFDEFTIDQIAGDMLPNPSSEQIIATAFHRNTMTNSEGGTDDEEFRTAAVVDRVNTTMQVWMGMTMGCAQCHSHKYDPISQEEYFQLFAILNQTEDADRGNEAPLYSEFSAQRMRQKLQVETEIKKLEAKIAAAKKETEAVALPQGELKARYIRVQGLGQMFLHLAEVQAFAEPVSDPQQTQSANLALSGVPSQSSTDFNGPAKLGNDGNPDGDFQKGSVTHTASEKNPWWEVDLKKPQSIRQVVVWNRTDSPAVRDRLKRFRVILLDADRRPIWTQTRDRIPDPFETFSVPQRADKLSGEDRDTLAALIAETGVGQAPEQKRLAELKKRLANLSKPDITTPIMKQLPLNRQRTTHVHIRGDFRSPGEVVKPGIPSVFHPLSSATQAPGRLDLARWLVDRNNPMTARVIVNRFWEKIFGTGIVETSEDFGTQGELPSHPQLLDYLAVEFMEQGWDVKYLLKKIVTSATYRQSSAVTENSGRVDPLNRWLSRGPRSRMSAEMIRDQALFVSETLSSKMNGPSVRPPRPKLGLRAAFGGTTDWDPSPGEDAYRRGLYTSWRRTAPYPSMTTFDAPSREFCTIRRSRTNTPLQALVLLNDPVYLEAARNLAKLTLNRAADEKSRLVYIFRKTLIRPPTSDELELMKKLLVDSKARLTADQAKTLVGGLSKEFARAGLSDQELAGWVVLGNVMLNLDETISRP